MGEWATPSTAISSTSCTHIHDHVHVHAYMLLLLQLHVHVCLTLWIAHTPRLAERCRANPQMENEGGMQFIDSLVELLRRLLDYRTVQQGDEFRDLHMHVMFNLLNFYKEMGREEIYIRCVYVCVCVCERAGARPPSLHHPGTSTTWQSCTRPATTGWRLPTLSYCTRNCCSGAPRHRKGKVTTPGSPVPTGKRHSTMTSSASSTRGR